MADEITLEGTVIDAETKLPLPGHHVEAWDTKPERAGRYGIATSDPDGRFTIAFDKARLPANADALEVHWKVFRRKKLALETTSREQREMTLAVPPRPVREDRLKPELFHALLGFYYQSDFSGLSREASARLKAYGGFGVDALKDVVGGDFTVKPVRGVNTTTSSIVGVSTDMAKAHLAERNVEVAEVLPYQPHADRDSLRVFTSMPVKLEAGERVTLYEENGQVKYYALTRKVERETPRDVADVQAEVETLKRESARKDEMIAELRAALTRVQERDAEKDAALEEVKKSLTKLRSDHNKLKEKVG